jgi:hypothetical protein
LYQEVERTVENVRTFSTYFMFKPKSDFGHKDSKTGKLG